jgi:hypothetical protein
MSTRPARRKRMALVRKVSAELGAERLSRLAMSRAAVPSPASWAAIARSGSR